VLAALANRRWLAYSFSARTHISKHRVGCLQPELGLHIVLKELEDEIAYVGDIFQVLANFLGCFCVKADRALRGSAETDDIGEVHAIR
jgi:hypothetical protein